MLDYGGCYLYELVHARTVRGKKEKKKKNLSHAIYKMPLQHSVVNSFANLCYHPAFEADKSFIIMIEVYSPLQKLSIQ